MSQKNRLLAELKGANRKACGAHLSLEARDRHLKLFVEYCAVRGFGLVSVDQIKSKHIVRFAEFLQASDQNPRTVHNILASIRSCLRAAGKNLKNMHLTKNQDLGLAKGERKGKKEPFPDALLFQLLILLGGSDIGLFAALVFERFLGLRGMEAIRSHQSLDTWRRELDANQPLSVIFGTKGGKPRKVFVNPKNVVWLRLAYTKGHSPLIDAPTLKQAVRRYRHQCEKIGFTGRSAPHSLRYRYTVEILEYCRSQGYSEHEALSMASMSLGHGNARGRWIKMVYARSGIGTDRASADQNCRESIDEQ